MANQNAIILRSEKGIFLLFEEMEKAVLELQNLILEYNSFVNVTYSNYIIDYDIFHQNFLDFQVEFEGKLNDFIKYNEAVIFTNSNIFYNPSTLIGGGSATNFNITNGDIVNVTINGNGIFNTLTSNISTKFNGGDLNNLVIAGLNSSAVLNNLTVNGITNFTTNITANNLKLSDSLLNDISIGGINSNGSFNAISSINVDLNGGTGTGLIITNNTLTDATIDGINSNVTLKNLTVNGIADLTVNGDISNFDITNGVLTDVTIDGAGSTGIFSILDVGEITLNGGISNNLTITNSVLTDCTIDGINSNATFNSLNPNAVALNVATTSSTFDISNSTLTDATINGTNSNATFNTVDANTVDIDNGDLNLFGINNSTLTDATISGSASLKSLTSIDATFTNPIVIGSAINNNHAITIPQVQNSINERYFEKNLLLNGAFDIWQRVSNIILANFYIADKWKTSDINFTDRAVSRVEFTPSEINTFKTRYYLRFDSSLQTTFDNWIAQEIEGVHVKLGKKYTASFNARANIEPAQFAINIKAYSKKDITNTYTETQTDWIDITTTWDYYNVVLDMPFDYPIEPIDDTARVVFTILFTNNANIFDITKIQLEEGEVASDFEFRYMAKEIINCQRYYQQNSRGYVSIVDSTGTKITFTGKFPISMMNAPSINLRNLSGAVNIFDYSTGNVIQTFLGDVLFYESTTEGFVVQFEQSGIAANTKGCIANRPLTFETN